jgi:hypothetical protein
VEEEKQRRLNTGEPLRELPTGVFHSANMAILAEHPDPFHGYKYDSFNPDALLQRATVKNGRVLMPGGASYSVLVIPGTASMQPNAQRMSAAVAGRLLELVKQGATVLLDDTMTATPGLFQEAKNDSRLRELYAQLAGASFKTVQDKSGESFLLASIGKGKLIKGPFRPASFEGIGLSPDFIARDANGLPAEGISFAHRRAMGLDIYFISNQLNSPQTLSLSLRVANRAPELWDAVTGEVTEAGTWQMQNGRTLLSVRLPAGGSLFVVLRKPASVQKMDKGANWYEPAITQILSAPWTVRFDTAYRGPSQPVVFDSLSDWSLNPDSSIQYYSGTAAYTQSFIWNGTTHRSWLDLGRVGVIAQVWVNDMDCGIAWTSPWRVEITKALQPGNNRVTIKVTNTWANRLQGDHRLPEAQRLTWTNAPYRLENKALPPSGLPGPVTIQQ